MPLLAVSLTTDPVLISVFAASATIPWLLFGLPAGPIIDRSNRLTLLYRLEYLRFVIAAILSLSVAISRLTMPRLIVLVVILGAIDVLFDNAAQTAIPDLLGSVDQVDLARLNGRVQAIETGATSFAGPPLGSSLFALSQAIPFVGQAALFFVSGTALRIGLPEHQKTTRVAERHNSILRSLRDGVSWLWTHRTLRILAGIVAAVNLLFAAADAVFVLYATQILGIRAAAFGLLLGAAGIGGVAGGLAGPRFAARYGMRASMTLGLLIPSIAQGVVALTTFPAVAAGAFMLAAFGGTTWNVATVTFRQSQVPSELLGRVNATYRFVAWGTMPVGALLGGLAAAAFGIRIPYAVAAVGGSCLAALVWRLPQAHGISAGALLRTSPTP